VSKRTFVSNSLESLVEDQSAGELSIQFTADVQSERLEPLLESVIYRIAQEAISNVRRHSKSDRTEIRLTQRNDRIRMEIRDWGVGFNPDRIEGKRLGLKGIRERARLMRGRAVIDSAPGKGTRMCVDLPSAPPPEETAITNDRSIE
jgi:signal transduction histidine kinase